MGLLSKNKAILQQLLLKHWIWPWEDITHRVQEVYQTHGAYLHIGQLLNTCSIPESLIKPTKALLLTLSQVLSQGLLYFLKKNLKFDGILVSMNDY